MNVVIRNQLRNQVKKPVKKPIKKPVKKPVKKSKKIILILQAASDHNNAFDKDGDRGLLAVF